MKRISFTLIFIVTLNLSQSFASYLTIGTYNLWNLMFNWEVRVEHIADMVRKANIDVLVFQEVRMSDHDSSHQRTSQLNRFRSLLPDYKWIYSHPSALVSESRESMENGWQMEGLGVISRREILSVKVVNLTFSNSEDKNPRIALCAKILVDPTSRDVASIWVVHFSYDRKQQCQNALEVTQHVSLEKNLKKVLILGDFNAYNNWNSPMEMFTFNGISRCPGMEFIDSERDEYFKASGAFKDAWLASGQNSRIGLTFSNMPSPGLISRPDRILVHKNTKIIDTGLQGYGDKYAYEFYQSVIWHRVKAVVASSYNSLLRRNGYFCLHDCGPHGSCRCGVCVKGGNDKECDVPTCAECDNRAFVFFISFFVPFCAATALLFYAVLRLLVVSARFSQRDLEDILGYRCCLFNRQLFRFSAIPRKYRSICSSLFEICRLPPLILILLTSTFLVLNAVMMRAVLHDSFLLVYSVLPEELNPSDHLMVYATVDIS